MLCLLSFSSSTKTNISKFFVWNAVIQTKVILLLPSGLNKLKPNLTNIRKKTFLSKSVFTARATYRSPVISKGFLVLNVCRHSGYFFVKFVEEKSE